MAVDMGSAIAYLLLDTTNFNTALSGAQNGLVSAGAKMASAGATMTATVTRGLVKLGQTAVTESANFESAMSQVRATMLKSTDEFNSEMGTVMLGAGENMREFTGNLTDFALEMASTTKFTATEAAAALNYMALAGYNTQESMGMLPNVLNLAAAGAMDLALASDMVTDTQTAFGISFERTSQLVDEMAKAASTGNTSVQQLGEAFLTVGGLAKNLNGGMVALADGTQSSVDGVQELEIALTAMANAGIKGGEAGTHMRNVLLKLASPTSDGTKRLKDLGVEVFDTEGKMRSLSGVFGDLGTSMSNLTQEEKLQAISELFNVRDTATVEALLSAVSQDWNEIGESILNAAGAADEMSQIQLDNLTGQITILKSGIQVAAIRFGNLMLPAIKKVVGWVQRLVIWLGSLDDAQKKTVMRIALVVAAIGPALLIIGRLISLIGAASQGFALLGSAGAGSAGLIGAALFGLIAIFTKLYKTSDNFKNKVTTSFESVRKSAELFVSRLRLSINVVEEPLDNLVKRFEEPFINIINSLSKGFSELFDGLGKSLGKFSLNLTKFIDSVNFEKLFSAFGKIGEIILDITSIVFPGFIDIFGSLLVAATPAINAVITLFDNLVEAIKKVAGPIAEGVLTKLKEFAESENVKNFFEDLGKFITDVGDGLAKILESEEVKRFLDELGKVAETASKGFEKLTKRVKEFLDKNGVDIGELSDKILLLISGVSDLLAAFNDFFDKDYPNAGKNVKSGLEKIGEALEWAYYLYKGLTGDINNLIEDLVVGIMIYLATSDIPIISTIAKIWLSVHAKVDEVKGEAETAVDDLLQSVEGKLSGSTVQTEGESLVDRLKAGLESGWNSLVAWFDSIPVIRFAKKISTDGAFSGGGGGHHFGAYATGLDYVPRTMQVTVHRGERILTQKENEEYNKGGSIEVTTYQNDEAINAMNSTMKQLLSAVNEIKKMPITLDSKKLVGGLVSEMDRQLGIRAERARGAV